MNKLQKQETGLTKKIDLDQFKSIYYLLNAKPDSQIRLLKENKKICFDALLELNNAVISKLKTESLETSITTITVVFKNKKVNTYNNWLEFERTNWQVSDQTLSVSINWDINIKLPEHELPQRHTLKVRLGSPIRPNEIFQLMMTSDKDDELMEATSNGVCKVDFINAVIANELLVIVEEWYSALPNNLSKNKIIRFGEKYRRYITFVINSIIPLSAIFIGYNLISRKILSITEWSSSTYNSVLFTAALSVSIIYVASIISRLVSNKVFRQLKEFSGYSMFEITKGDKNSIDDIDKKNNKIKTGVLTQFVIALVVTIISLYLGKIIDKI
jgi:uncharacterized membrane protein